MSVAGIISGVVELGANITGGAIGRKTQARQLEQMQFEAMNLQQQQRFLSNLQEKKLNTYMILGGGVALLTIFIIKKTRKK